MRWIAAVIGERPLRDALLAEVGILDMVHPRKETDVAFDDGAKPLDGVRLVTGDARGKLRHEPGMVEHLFLRRAQVGLRASHPQHVVVEDHFLVVQSLAVVVDQPFLREREQAVDAGIDEPVGFTRLLI